MDQAIQVQSIIQGSYSGNTGNNNTIGINNTTIVLPGVSSLKVRSQDGVVVDGYRAPRPYRLIPYGRNSTFTGRKNLILSLRSLSELKAHNRVALYGLGGSGKTQIALEYVYQCASESDCDVYWVHGSAMLKFNESFKAIAQLIRIPLASSETDEEGFLFRIRRWFESPNSGDWILIIDNADNDADFSGNNSPMAKFVPQGTKGTIIFTTRSRQVALRQGCKLIEVGKMELEECLELFSKRFEGWDGLEDEEKEVVAEILNSVHHLPLAVVGSAAFMAETQTPPSEYWNIFQEHEERTKELLSEEFCDIQREADMTESILGTYFVTFDQILEQMPIAADLLRLIVFFDRQNIPEELLRKCGLEGMDDAIKFRRAIGKLLGFSLVTTVKRENHTFYELHRLVQLSLQVYLPTKELSQWRATALGAISRLFPRSEDEWRYSGPVYISHALAVTKASTGPIAEELDYRVGRYFLYIGSYNNAEVQFRRCISLRDEGKNYDWDDEGHWRFRDLGQAILYQGKADVAEKIFRDLLEGSERSLGSDNPHILVAVRDLALVLQYQGKYKESEAMIRRALAEHERVLGPGHLDTLTSVSNLALVLQSQGRYSKSEKLNRRALEGREKVLGPDHPDTLSSVNNLAVVLECQGDYNISEAMKRHVLCMREKVLGPDHPDTLSSVSNLAVALRLQGKYDESETLNRRALEGREKVVGPDHPDTLTSISNLALMLQSQGKYDESETLNWRALEGRESVLGLDHPDTLLSVNNLAVALRLQGKYDESETLNRRALEGCEKVLGLDHPDTLTSISNLALMLQSQGQYDKSEPLYWRVLVGREKVLGLDHPDTLTTISNLALMLLSQGRYDESETLNRRTLEGREKVLGLDHPDTLTSVNNLASVLQSQGKYDESEPLYRRALERQEKVLGPDHPDTLTSVGDLSLVLRCLGKYDELRALDRRTP